MHSFQSMPCDLQQLTEWEECSEVAEWEECSEVAEWEECSEVAVVWRACCGVVGERWGTVAAVLPLRE